MLEKIQIYICIVAALVVSIINVIQNVSLTDMAIRLISIIILSYFVGLIVKLYLSTKVFPKEEELIADLNNEVTEAENESSDEENIDDELFDFEKTRNTGEYQRY